MAITVKTKDGRTIQLRANAVDEAVRAGNINLDPAASHINTYLTDVGQAYSQDDMEFLYPRISRRNVAKASNDIVIWDPADMLRRQKAGEIDRAVNAGFNRVTFKTEDQTYKCKDYGLESLLDDQVTRNADPEVNVRENMTVGLFNGTKRIIENDVISRLFVSGVGGAGNDIDLTSNSQFGGDLTGVTWNASNSNPSADMAVIINNARWRGLKPNVGAVFPQTYNQLLAHPILEGKIEGYSTPDSPAILEETRQVARLLRLDELYVIESIWNDANTGADDDVKYVGDSAGMLIWHQVSAVGQPGQQNAIEFFNWTGLTGATDQMGLAAFDYRDESHVSDVIRVRGAFDIKVIYPHAVGWIPVVFA